MLLDLSEITSLPTSSQLSAVTTEIARVRPRVQFDGCAIIASRDALFGMARMFEVFAESYLGRLECSGPWTRAPVGWSWSPSPDDPVAHIS